MRTNRQIEASRANGSKSRGPVTQEGKLASSRNAIKHGVLSECIVLPGERADSFQSLTADLFEEHRPVGSTEEDLVEMMAVSRWRRMRIVGLPGTEGSVRGFSAVSLLLIDEASRVEDRLYKALLPMLATTNGDLWLLSTPCGKRGFFYEEWEYGGPAWFRISVPATECPRIDAAFLENARNTLGSDWYAQEYLAQFVDNGLSYFSRDIIEAALDDSFKALDL